MEDSELYRQWRRTGSPDALVALLAAVQRSVFPLCLRILRHRQDAEDACQKVFLEALDVLPTLPSLDRIRGWTYRTSILTALSLKRARRRRLKHERTPRPAEEPALSEEEIDLLHRQIAELDEDLRRVVIEHYFEQRTLSQLSTDAHCSTSAVWKRLQKAQDELRRSLTRAGIPCGAGAALAFLGSREAEASPTAALPADVVDKARRVAPGVPRSPLPGRGMALKAAAGTAAAFGILLGSLALRHGSFSEPAPRLSREAAVPHSRSAAPSSATPVGPAASPLAPPAESPPEDLFARLMKLRGTIEVCLAKKGFGPYTREREALHPLVLREPETYVRFLQMSESREYFGFYLDILQEPSPLVGGADLPDLPRAISKGLAERLSSGTVEQRLLILDRVLILSQSFRRQTLVEDLLPPCFQLVAGPNETLRMHALGFLMSHGQEERVDLVQSVWQLARKEDSRKGCINLLAWSKAPAARELFYRYLDEMLARQDPEWIRSLPILVEYRLQNANTPEDHDRCRTLLSSFLRREVPVLELQHPLAVACRLPVATLELLLKDLSGHAPSDELNDRVARTLSLIARGETNSGVLLEMLVFGRSVDPPPPVPIAPPPPPVPVAAPPEGATATTEPFEVVSDDGRLKAVIGKGPGGFATELQIWDLEKDDRLTKGAFSAVITAFAFSPDGKRYAMAERDGVVVYSLNGGSTRHFRTEVPVKSLKFANDGQSLEAPGQSWPLTKP